MINFDNAATSKLDEAVKEKYVSYLNMNLLNPSSPHFAGYEVFKMLEKARLDCLKLLNLDKSHQLIFTSGATEANNLAIKGVAIKYQNRGKHLITTKIEHPSVINVFHHLEKDLGFEVTYLSPNKDGIITLEELKKHVRKDTILVSIMAINNETGAINPIEEIASFLKKFPKVFFHVDIAQAIGHLKLDYSNVDLLSFSAHKIHGLKGSGALIYRKNIIFSPLFYGGEQEASFRSGTEDVEKDLVLYYTISNVFNLLDKNYLRMKSLHDKLYDGLLKLDKFLILNSLRDGSSFIINFSLKKLKASVLVEALSNAKIYVSTSSACSAKKSKMSYVIFAMFNDTFRAENSIRLSLGYDNNEEDVDIFLKTLKELLERLSL